MPSIGIAITFFLSYLVCVGWLARGMLEIFISGQSYIPESSDTLSEGYLRYRVTQRLLFIESVVNNHHPMALYAIRLRHRLDIDA